LNNDGSSIHILKDRDGKSINLETGYIINCAGLHADRVAKKLGFG